MVVLRSLILVLAMILVYSAVIVGIVGGVTKHQKTKREKEELKELRSLLKKRK